MLFSSRPSDATFSENRWCNRGVNRVRILSWFRLSNHNSRIAVKKPNKVHVWSFEVVGLLKASLEFWLDKMSPSIRQNGSSFAGWVVNGLEKLKRT